MHIKQVYKLWKLKYVVVLECIKLNIIMVVVYCYLKRKYYKFLFHVNNYSYFEISA